MGKIVSRREIEDEVLAFHLFDLYEKGLHLSKGQMQLLYSYNYVAKEPIPIAKEVEKPESVTERSFNIPSDNEWAGVTDVIESVKSGAESPVTIIANDDRWNSTTSKANVLRLGGTITKDMWIPDSMIYHTPEFVAWIDSISNDYITRTGYNKYNLYVQQAEEWMADTKTLVDFDSTEEQRDFLFKEYERCDTNTLYFALKHAYMKEAEIGAGRLKYSVNENYEHHKILFYLIDCGYCLLVGKPRQGGFTTIFGIYGMKRTLFRRNHYTKMITADMTKGEEIFRDKFKYVYGELQRYMQDEIANDSATLFTLGKKTKKGDVSGINSRIEVVPPHVTAINGGQPNLVIVDEIGDISNLTEMVNEGRPALFWRNPMNNGKLELKRQLIMFGTGVYNQSNTAFEREWKRLYKLWKEGDYEAGIIPIFFDWNTRCSKEEYEKEKRYYYGGNHSVDNNQSLEASKIQFHQHYPSSPSDMFLTVAKTLVSRDEIDKNINKIKELEPTMRPVYGYYEPLFDANFPYDENSDVPFKIIGSQFIACDPSNDKVCAIMWMPPEKGWVNRYWQGTDPISSDTGVSKMGSAIWDGKLGTVSCAILSRTQGDPKWSFLQCMLMGMHYDINSYGVKELLERNIGLTYAQYQEVKGNHRRLVLNSELPDFFMSGPDYAYGIDNRGARTRLIISKLQELINTYGKNIYVEEFWEELRTFVFKISKTGNESWESIDKRYFPDDLLFAVVFSYICFLSFPYAMPKKIDEAEVIKKNNGKLGFEYDKNYNLIRKRRKIRG